MLLEAVLCEQLIYTWPKKEKKKHFIRSMTYYLLHHGGKQKILIIGQNSCVLLFG
jgi:hypothetical protein